ncbi:MAG: sodium/proton antiporter NhaB [Gammaproteobacteria bacterium]|nr:sodium/proton antiporter NhaB [Gammaproteobacteria bacterium]NNM14407.1 sodium/proton antiporter NhaB [Gammaproteobacteria bacterium]
MNMTQAFAKNFLGNSPDWYKFTIIGCLILNPILFHLLGGFWAGWIMVGEFILTLAMALKCYPLQPGGLIALEAVLIGMTTPGHAWHELQVNLGVIALLMFMVAGIYFMKDMLLYVFTKILLRFHSKIVLSVLFCAVSAILSAFLDALTVIAVVITVATGFYSVYHRVASGATFKDEGEVEPEIDREELREFRAFLRNLMMHAGVGTALGGVMTQVGEPQNLIIADKLGWDFVMFFKMVAPVSLPVFVAGLFTCFLVEKFKIFSYGASLPNDVRTVLRDFDEHETKKRRTVDNASLIAQGAVAIVLVIALYKHVAQPGMIGLMVIVLATTFTGVTEEHQIGKAFEEALPFTSLLVVFFVIVAMIGDQGLFKPVIEYVFSKDPSAQPGLFFMANGVLSMMSDNVFVASVYIKEVEQAFCSGVIARDHYEALAIAINTGTNLPSVATPNGQAAFLFLLTSALAPTIRLSYMRMVWLAVPYTIVLTIVGLIATLNYDQIANVLPFLDLSQTGEFIDKCVATAATTGGH